MCDKLLVSRWFEKSRSNIATRAITLLPCQAARYGTGHISHYHCYRCNITSRRRVPIFAKKTDHHVNRLADGIHCFTLHTQAQKGRLPKWGTRRNAGPAFGIETQEGVHRFFGYLVRAMAQSRVDPHSALAQGDRPEL